MTFDSGPRARAVSRRPFLRELPDQPERTESLGPEMGAGRPGIPLGVQVIGMRALPTALPASIFLRECCSALSPPRRPVVIRYRFFDVRLKQEWASPGALLARRSARPL